MKASPGREQHSWPMPHREPCGPFWPAQVAPPAQGWSAPPPPAPPQLSVAPGSEPHPSGLPALERDYFHPICAFLLQSLAEGSTWASADKGRPRHAREPDPQNEAPGLSLIRAEEKQGSIAPAEDTGIIPTPLIRFRELQTQPPQDPPPWDARNCTSFSSLMENEGSVPEKEDRTCHRRNPCSDLCSALRKLSEPHFPHLNSRDDLKKKKNCLVHFSKMRTAMYEVLSPMPQTHAALPEGGINICHGPVVLCGH